MLELSGCMPGLSSEESNEMIHKLLTDSMTSIFSNAKDADEDPTIGMSGSDIFDSYFPEYLEGTGIPEKKLNELSKMLVSSGEYTPDLEIEYAINKILEEMKDYDDDTMEVAGEFYYKAGSDMPDDFYEELWECIFWDNDYTFLDEGHTLETIQGSPIDKQMGITGGISKLPDSKQQS